MLGLVSARVFFLTQPLLALPPPHTPSPVRPNKMTAWGHASGLKTCTWVPLRCRCPLPAKTPRDTDTSVVLIWPSPPEADQAVKIHRSHTDNQPHVLLPQSYLFFHRKPQTASATLLLISVFCCVATNTLKLLRILPTLFSSVLPGHPDIYLSLHLTEPENI